MILTEAKRMPFFSSFGATSQASLLYREAVAIYSIVGAMFDDDHLMAFIVG